jgi:hypothetical protein
VLCVLCDLKLCVSLYLQCGVYRRERGRSYGEDGDSGCWEQYRAASRDRVDMVLQQDRDRVDMAMQQDRNRMDMVMQQDRNRMDIQDMVIKTARRRNRVSIK